MENENIIAKPEEPALIPEEPVIKPEEPALIPEEPALIPDEPTIKPEEPALIPDEPALIPEEPALIPDEPALIPEEPTIKPEEPQIIIKEQETIIIKPTIEIPTRENKNIKEILINLYEKIKDNIHNIDKVEPMIKDYDNDEENPQILIAPDEEQTPKINNNLIDFINRNSGSQEGGNNIINTTVTADLVSINGGGGDITASNLNKRTDELLDIIHNSKKKILNNLYIVSSKYDLIYFRYNRITLSILIISTMITFIEAIKLTLINYDTQYTGSKISLYISQETISLIFSVLSLCLSTILTILSSIVKFKNFKENMDKLKSIHDTLFNYKNLYDKQKEIIKYFKISNNLTEELYEKVQETVENYNKEIKDISIFENIRNADIIRFNKIKVDHDIKMQKIATKREIELLRITTNTKKIKETIENKNASCCFKL